MLRAIRTKNEGCSSISILRIFNLCLALGVLFGDDCSSHTRAIVGGHDSGRGEGFFRRERCPAPM